MQFKVKVLQPAMVFIASLEPKLQAKALRAIDMLAHFGPQLPMPHSRKLAGYNLWELRVRHASNICRLFYFHDLHNTYVISSGYIKKTTKTNFEQIQRAARIRDAYLRGENE
jgi:phage-related protein